MPNDVSKRELLLHRSELIPPLVLAFEMFKNKLQNWDIQIN